MIKKILFYTLLAVIAATGTVVAMAISLPSDYQLQSEVEIAARPETVFVEVSDLKNWPTWSPWKKKDPGMELSFEDGKTTRIGDISYWKSRNSGSGSMRIVESAAPVLFKYEMQFDGWSNPSEGDFNISSTETGSKVTWSMRGHRGFIEKMFWMLFKVEQTLAEDFAVGLQLLKTHLEKK